MVDSKEGRQFQDTSEIDISLKDKWIIINKGVFFW